MAREMSKIVIMRERKDEIWQIAVDRYLEKNDFDVFDWLTDDERIEFEELQKKLGEIG